MIYKVIEMNITSTFIRFALSLITIVFFILISCQFSKHAGSKAHADNIKNPQDDGISATSSNRTIMIDTMRIYHAEYTPLTLEVLQDIRNGNITFSEFRIIYSKNFRRATGSGSINELELKAGPRWKEHDYTVIDEFTGTYIDKSVITGIEPTKVAFTKAEVDSILDYIENNPVYFFNHEEFDGADEYLSRFWGICYDVYTFSISIIKLERPPEDEHYYYAWGITKCAEEYPEPDHALYELFEMLEDDFISQFE